MNRWLTRWLIVVVSGAILPGAAAALVNYRISGEPPKGGSIQTTIAFTPDGSRVLYRADHHARGVVELYSAPSDGSGAPVRLNGPLDEGEEVGGVALISPTSDRVFYFIRQRASRTGVHYHVAPLDGEGPLAPLPVPMRDDDTVKAWVSTPDGTREVVGIGGQTASGIREVWAWAHNGGEAVLVTSSSGSRITTFQVTPDGRQLVYLVQPSTNARLELYGAPLAGGGTPVKLTDASPASFPAPLLTPDGARVVFVGSDPAGSWGVYSAPVDRGGAAVKLNAGGTAGSVRLAGDGQTVLYDADQDVRGAQEIYRVPTDGTRPASRLNGALEPGTSVEWWESSPDRTLVAYYARHAGDDGPAVWVAPVAGGAARRVTGVFAQGASLAYGVFSADGTRVLYVAGEGTDIPYHIPTWELLSAPVDGATAPVKLNAPLGTTHSVNRILAATQSGLVVYDAALLGGRPGGLGGSMDRRLYAVPVDGSSPALSLMPPLGSGNSTDRLPLVSADGARVAFVTTRFYEDPAGVYVAPTDGSSPAVRVDASRVPAGLVSNVTLSPDGRWAVYKGNDGGTEAIYGVRVDGSSAPRALIVLNGGGVDAIRFTPDSRRIVVTAHAKQVAGGYVAWALLSAPIAASAPAVELSTTGAVVDFTVSPAGTRVVYRGHTGELFGAPVDGSEQPVKLSPPVLPGRWVAGDFAVTADSRYVVFRSEIDADDVRSLFSAPLDGRGAAIPLHVATNDFGIGGFELTPDGQGVVYHRPAFGTEPPGVYWAAVDGSGQRLLAASSETTEVWALGVAGSGLVYLSSPVGVDGAKAFYSTPLDGTGAPQALECVAGKFGLQPENMLVTGDGRYLVYSLQRYSSPPGEPWGVYTCPLDGTGAGIRLDDALESDDAPYLSGLSPDGRWVLFRDAYPASHLWARLVDGSAPAKLIAAGAGMHGISSDSRLVLLKPVGAETLMTARLDGNAAPVSVMPVLPPSDLSGYDSVRLREPQFTADSRAVVYVADQDAAGTWGLWVTRLDAEPATCPGDCNGDAEVTIDEVIAGVRIAAGLEPVGTCTAFDLDANGSVTVDELVAAVQRVLAGCG